MQLGQLIRGKYRLVRLLGDGGMGSVYEATHEGLGTRVAIKVLHSDLARRPGLVERFMREARVSAQIRSANVVQVTDVDRTEGGDAYIVMELLEGEPLSSVLTRERKVSIATACDYTMQILQSLEAAHGLGVVHRDLKPENVFVTFVAGKPLLKLIDFGIAKAREMDSQAKNLTIAGVVMGTAEYMAPEQAHSADRVDARSDVYAVGVMLYEMIAGERPVSGDDARVIAVKVERGDVKPLVHAAPDVPRDLAGLVHRAMAARPELRFASAAEMRLALAASTSGKRSPTAPIPELGTGTVMGAPADVALTGARAAVAPLRTSPGDGASGLSDGRSAAQPGQHWGEHSPPGTEREPDLRAGGATGAIARAPEGAGRRRKRGSSTWLLVLLPVLLGAGLVTVFAVNASRETPPTPLTFSTSTSTSTSTATATATVTATTTTAAAVDTVAPLIPSPTSHVPVHPHPTTSASASGAPSGTAVPGPTSPFPTTLPSVFPSTFPSGIPFPFPPPTGSGLGPVFTIPTTLPQFPPPTPPPAPQEPSPPPPSSAPGF